MNDLIKKYIQSLDIEELSKNEIEDKMKLYYLTRDSILREQIIISSLKYVNELIKNVEFGNYGEREDVESLAYEVLIRCVERFDPNKGESFFNYLSSAVYKSIHLKALPDDTKYRAYLDIKREIEKREGLLPGDNLEILDEIVNEMVNRNILRLKELESFKNRINIIHASSYENLEDEYTSNDDVENIVINEDIKRIIMDIISTLLPELQRYAILKYGLDGRERTVDEVSSALGVDKSKLRSYQEKLVKCFRHPARLRGNHRELIEYRSMDEDNLIESPHEVIQIK